MAVPNSYIGALISVSAAVPATVDASGFNALSWTLVGKIVSWGSVGDTTDNISVPLLSGRVVHLNGASDGGEIAFTFVYDTAPDSGQTIIINNSNTNVNCSTKIVDPDSKIAYNFGLFANVQDMERTNGGYKGLSGVFRVNSATVRA